jgi:hypothetical protein
MTTAFSDGTKIRSVIHVRLPNTAMHTSRKIIALPSFVPNSGPHEVGDNEDPIPVDPSCAFIAAATKYVETKASIEICRKYFSVIGYSTPSGHIRRMKTIPPNNAATKKNAIHRNNPSGPPTRGVLVAVSPSVGILVSVPPGVVPGTVVVA